MKVIVNFLIFICTIYLCYGMKGYISLVYPVSWSQDVYLSNNGYDIISLKNSGRAYFEGTYWQKEKFINGGNNETKGRFWMH